VGEDGEGSGGDDGAANGEAVKAVGKVDGIAVADDDQDDENYKRDKGNEREMWDVAEKSESQMRVKMLEERHAELGGVVALRLHGNERDGDGGGNEELRAELGPSGEAKVAPMDDLDVVIGKTDGSKGQRGTHGQPDERVGQIGPEQRGQQDGDTDEDPAHGGRSGFLLVLLGAFFADV